MPRFAVIGLGRFGAKLAQSLTAAGAEVIAVDTDRDLVEELRDEVTFAIRMDATDEQALRSQGIDKVDVAVVGIGTHFESAALATSQLKSIGVPRVISRAATEVRGRILSRIGADAIVYPEGESAVRWAHRLMIPRLEDLIELGEEHSLVQLPAPEAFHNKSLGQIGLRRKYGVNLVAIQRRVAVETDTASPAETSVVSVPDAATVILPNDLLVLVGSNESIAGLAKS